MSAVFLGLNDLFGFFLNFQLWWNGYYVIEFSPGVTCQGRSWRSYFCSWRSPAGGLPRLARITVPWSREVFTHALNLHTILNRKFIPISICASPHWLWSPFLTSESEFLNRNPVALRWLLVIVTPAVTQWAHIAGKLESIQFPNSQPSLRAPLNGDTASPTIYSTAIACPTIYSTAIRMPYNLLYCHSHAPQSTLLPSASPTIYSTAIRMPHNLLYCHPHAPQFTRLPSPEWNAGRRAILRLYQSSEIAGWAALA